MESASLQENKKRLLAILLKDAFCREKITLSSGKTSDFYIDARRVTLAPEGVNLCARIILEMLKNDRVDAIGGPMIGADPIVGAVSAISFELKTPLNAFIVRKASKPYGKQQQIEGPILKPGAQVVLIDDVATTGKSIIQSIDVLKAMNIDVKKAFCIVDRQEGAAEALAQKGCKLFSIFTIKDFPV